MEFIVPTRLTDEGSVENARARIPDGCGSGPIVVYQHPLDGIDPGFERYCLENPDTIGDAKVLVSLPASYVELDCPDIVRSMGRFVDSLNGLGFQLVGRVRVIPNREVDRTFQKRIGDLFGDEEGPDVFLTFYRTSEFVRGTTLAGAAAEIALGLISIPVCLALFLFGILDWNTPRVFGVAFAMIGGAPILTYIGAVNLEYRRWLGKRRQEPHEPAVPRIVSRASSPGTWRRRAGR